MRSYLRVSLAASVAVGLAASFSFGQNTPEHAITKSYKTTTTPTIDGVPDEGEWDDAGPWLVVNAANGGPGANDGDEYGGDGDASFRFKSMWREDTYEAYFLFEITDDIAATEQPRESRTWERDQMEFFFEGNTLEGEGSGAASAEEAGYVFWNGDLTLNPETYGKFGVSRMYDGETFFEGNIAVMTDDQELWSDEFDPDAPILAVANTSDTGDNGNFYIEYGVNLLGMVEPPIWEERFPFEGTPTETEGHIVEDSTAIKFTAVYSDDDDVDFEATDRAHSLTYYRVPDTQWFDSTGFSTLEFTGEFEGVIEPTCMVPDGGVLGDLDGNGEVAFADFLTLSGNFGKSGELSYAEGDTDCNGKVEFADFLTLSGNFGKTAAGAAATVPEPSSATLLLLGLVAVVRRHRR